MIFEDKDEERWKKAKIAFGLMIFTALIIVGSWMMSILINPPLPSIVTARTRHEVNRTIQTSLIKTDVGRVPVNPIRHRMGRINPLVASTTISAFGIPTDHPWFTVFINQDSPETIRSLSENNALIDIAFPDWFTVQSTKCDVSSTIDDRVTALITDHHIKLLPRVSNVASSGWKSKEFSQLLTSESARTCLASTLLARIIDHHADGINLDFEELEPAARENYLDFLETITRQFHAAGKLVTVDVPVNDPAFDMEYIGATADAVVVMTYDEHYAGGTPGPIASQDWYNDVLNQALGQIPKNKILMGIGNYTYDWNMQATTTPAQSFGFADTMALAAEQDVQPEMETSTRNMAFVYQADNGDVHQVWFLNGVTAWNEWQVSKKSAVLGSALWRLGTEDPLVWKFLRRPTSTTDILATSSPLHTITYRTNGEVFRVISAATPGMLTMTTDQDDLVDYAQYSSLPQGYVLERVGNPIPKKQLVLTFDDGPDPVWTPQIINVLNKYHTPATFFVVGSQAQEFPGVLSDEAKNGFMVGNHSYTHPDISKISAERLMLEANETQRTIEAGFGTKTLFFRPPYDTDSSPSTLAQVRPIDTLTKMGYVMVGANIDSSDWERPGVDTIISNIERGLHDPDSHIIVLHDAGGDRSQTVAALDRLIPMLERQGYTFVGLDTALGLTKASLNPPLESREWWLVFITKLTSLVHAWWWSVITWLFFITTGLSLFRLLFLGYFALVSHKHIQQLPVVDMSSTLVTVLIPAFNEEKTIERTLVSLAQSSHRSLDIIVIDDGSTDATCAYATAYAQHDVRVRVISGPNGGKAEALNQGIAAARGSIIVIIDADTIVYPGTVEALIKPFNDPRVDAACGNVEVGNVHNILTAFQALEYIVTQNFDRRAFDELNCISVVPGATGAWRTAKLKALGGFTHDTLTEDADITLRLLRSGGKIVYVSEARSKTEAPEDMRGLAKQRFRWSYGTFQCFYKHRDALFKGALGWVALPNMFLFQVVFPILSPLGDLIFLLAIFRGDLGPILIGYVLFLSMDVCAALLGFALEKKGDKRLLALTLIQRFFYRQFMYVVTYRTIMAVIRGRRHGWNKLQRTGRVQ